MSIRADCVVVPFRDVQGAGGVELQLVWHVQIAATAGPSPA